MGMGNNPLIKRATKQEIRLKAILAGLPGAGKTYTGLVVATRIATRVGSRLLVIDTEGGQSQTYADEFDFDVLELDDHAPKSYVDAIKLAIGEGYQIVLVDSFSHEWNGTNGILQQVGRERNKFSDGWGTATPLHDRFVQYLVHAPIHIIGTVRQKIVHVQEEDVSADGRKRTVIRKLGEQDQQRDTFLYELAWHAALDQQHTLTIDKSRYGSVPLLRVGQSLHEPGANLADAFLEWLGSGGVENLEDDLSAAPAEHEERQPPKRAAKVTPIRPAGPTVDAANDADVLDLSARNVADKTAQQEIVMRLYRYLDISDPTEMDMWLAKNVRPEGAPRGALSAQALRDGTSNVTNSEHTVALIAIDEQQQRQSQPAHSTRDARGAL